MDLVGNPGKQFAQMYETVDVVFLAAMAYLVVRGHRHLGGARCEGEQMADNLSRKTQGPAHLPEPGVRAAEGGRAGARTRRRASMALARITAARARRL